MQVKSFYRYRWDFCFDEDSSGKFCFVWAFLRILLFWWHTEAWQGSWETFSLCMRCSEVIISATQCVKSPATPCQNALFRFFNRAFCHTINAASGPKLVNHNMLRVHGHNFTCPCPKTWFMGSSSDWDREDISFGAFHCSFFTPSFLLSTWMIIRIFKIETTNYPAIAN